MANISKMALKTSKNLMRKSIRATLRNLTRESKERQSASITNKILSNSLYLKSNRIGVYLNTSEEVNTDALVKDILRSKNECFIPRCTDSTMDLVKLHSLEEYEAMPLNKWGIKEPRTEELRESCLVKGLDLVLVPGLGFTLSGKRLGKGKGYYDRFLAELSKKSSTSFSTIGMSFNEQIVEDLPTDENDFTMDFIVTA